VGVVPGRDRENRLRTSEVGVALSLTGVLVFVGVIRSGSYGFAGEMDTDDLSMIALELAQQPTD
jgi:hypothetical protein